MQTTLETPVEFAGPLETGLAIQQRARKNTLHDLARLRKEAFAEIDRLIAFLDASDPYVMTELEDDDDREPVGDDEPSLGSFDRVTNQEKSWRLGWADLDAELDTADNEPSLGSLERSCCAAGWRDGERNPTGDQTLWGHSPRNDLEDEHDGREPDESGIGDYDGLLEQIGTQDWQHGGMV